LRSPARKSNGKVFGLGSNFYAEWRQRGGSVLCLREDGSPPPEHLLQTVWFHQRLLREQLAMVNGRRLRVLHPGYWNREAGPDFRGAMLQFGDESPVCGDVEIDLDASGWRTHGHNRNPAFARVLLHVVWNNDSKTNRNSPQESTLPMLALKDALDAPVQELAYWLGSDVARGFPEALRGQCCAPLRDLSADRLTELLHHAALLRMQSKAAQLQARARQAGWEQALWEGLFRALGYKHNVWPMQHLAELRSRLVSDKSKAPRLTMQARLLGVGALLPAELTRTSGSTGRYLRTVWDIWWRERDAWNDCALPRALWRFHGLRPANHPQRRLALAAHWLAEGELPGRIERWGLTSTPAEALVSTLLKAMQAEPDEFWSWHWTLRSKPLAKMQPLLGATRVTDLAVNVVLPWLWMRAVEGKNESLRTEMERRFLSWPAGEDNAVLRLARERLLGGAPARVLAGAAAQQGLLQIVRDFCEHSNALCDECRFPELVKQWRGTMI